MLNLFLKLSTLSSLLPEYLALPRILYSSTGRGHSKKSMVGISASFVIPKTDLYPFQFSTDLGNPSMRKLTLPVDWVTSVIALYNNLTVISTGTILPAVIYSSINVAFGPPRCLSARRRSPADK